MPKGKPAPEPLYPALEGFIENARREDIDDVFASLKAGLTHLKGPRAEQGAKVSAAIERTEELLKFLMQVREKLEAKPPGKKK